MKKIIYIITGCFILGICTINSGVTITADNKGKELTALNNTKNAYWDCLEFAGCENCNDQYQDVKNAYDNFNKIK